MGDVSFKIGMSSIVNFHYYAIEKNLSADCCNLQL